MIVSQVLIGSKEPIKAKSGFSGINKRPQSGPVSLDRWGLERDAIIDTDNHGGPTQAVYIIGQKDYDYWEKTLARPLKPGTFGENLILTDLSTHDVKEGDVFKIGGIELHVTYPRIPCVTLAERMGDEKFPLQFSKSGHVGIYCSVKTGGKLLAGAKVEHIRSGTASILDTLPGYRKPD